MEKISRVAALGAGPGGLAVAAALSRRGYEVALYNRTPGRLEAAQKRGGIEIEGDLGEELVPIKGITTDLGEAVRGAQLILMAVPAYGQMATAEALLPYLQKGQTLLLLCGSAGSLEVGRLLRGAGFDLDDVLLGETVTLPQSARMVGDAKIRIRLPSRVRSAAFPGRNTERLAETLGDTLKIRPKPNVLDPGLNNPNFMIHPGPMLTNYAAIERAEGRFSIMNEGMTPGTLRLLDAIDAEKMALQQALGLEVVPIDDLYRENGSGPHIYRSPGEPFGLRDRIWDRYVAEDVPYGTVMYSSLGDLLGVPTPASDSTNTILSVLDQTDYWAQGRTVEKLGLAGLTREQVSAYLETGERP